MSEKDLLSFIDKKMATNFLLNDDGSKIVKIIKLSPSAMRYCVLEEDGLIKAMLESEKHQNLQSEPLKQVCRFRNEHFKNMILKAFLDDLNTGILDHVLNDVGLNCVTWNTELQFKKKTDEDTSFFDFNANDSRVIGKDSNGNIIPIKLMPEYIKHFPNVTRLAENLILILGSYKPEHIERIETIKKHIKEKHIKLCSKKGITPTTHIRDFIIKELKNA